MKKRNGYEIIAALVLILVIIFFVFSFIKADSLENEIQNQVKTGGLVSIGVFSFILDFLPQYIPPHIFILAHNLIGFNLIQLLFLVIIGSSLGSIVGFEIGRKMKNGNKLFGFIGRKKVKIFEKGINGWKKWVVSLAAISPIPYVPLILGMFNMSRRNFVLFGIIPRVIGFIVLSMLFI